MSTKSGEIESTQAASNSNNSQLRNMVDDWTRGGAANSAKNNGKNNTPRTTVSEQEGQSGVTEDTKRGMMDDWSRSVKQGNSMKKGSQKNQASVSKSNAKGQNSGNLRGTREDWTRGAKKNKSRGPRPASNESSNRDAGQLRDGGKAPVSKRGRS